MNLDYIELGDCLEGIKNIPDASVDLIVADPPYFLSMGHAGSKDNIRTAGNLVNSETLKSNRAFGDLSICKPFYAQLYAEMARVLKPDGAVYWFTDWRGYAFYFPIMNAALPVRNMICWDKISGPGSYYSFAHELIIYCNYSPRLKAKGGTNVWRMKSFSSGAKQTNGEKVHPTQKPVELIEKMILDSTDPGAVVLDPFMGSGTTAVAAIRTGRHYVGFEQDEAYHAVALQRAAAEVDRLLESEEAEA